MQSGTSNQPRSLESLSSTSWCSVWTSASCPDSVYTPKCTAIMWLVDSLVAAIEQVPGWWVYSSASWLYPVKWAHFQLLGSLVIGGERLIVQNIHTELQLIISENTCLLDLTEKTLFKGTNELDLHYAGFGNAELAFKPVCDPPV